MNIQWEIYSSLERKVIAKVTTSGAGDYRNKLAGNYAPAIYEGFRENARQFLANPQVRALVLASATTAAAGASAGGVPVAGPIADPTKEAALPAASSFTTSIALRPGATHLRLGQTTTAVAVVFSPVGSGSGFLVSQDGYLLTNQHVVRDSKAVRLKWSDGSESPGEVVRTDARRDVALIKTDPQGRAPLDVRLEPIEQGDPVYAIGSPLGEAQQNSMTKGIVSALRVRGGLAFIQSDAAITHGNSGGPLLDEKGRVIGVASSGLEANGAPLGINFFIPIEDALKALRLAPPGGDAPRETVAAAPGAAHTDKKP